MRVDLAKFVMNWFGLFFLILNFSKYCLALEIQYVELIKKVYPNTHDDNHFYDETSIRYHLSEEGPCIRVPIDPVNPDASLEVVGMREESTYFVRSLENRSGPTRFYDPTHKKWVGPLEHVFSLISIETQPGILRSPPLTEHSNHDPLDIESKGIEGRLDRLAYIAKKNIRFFGDSIEFKNTIIQTDEEGFTSLNPLSKKPFGSVSGISWKSKQIRHEQKGKGVFQSVIKTIRGEASYVHFGENAFHLEVWNASAFYVCFN